MESPLPHKGNPHQPFWGQKNQAVLQISITGGVSLPSIEVI